MSSWLYMNKKQTSSQGEYRFHQHPNNFHVPVLGGMNESCVARKVIRARGVLVHASFQQKAHHPNFVKVTVARNVQKLGDGISSSLYCTWT